MNTGPRYIKEWFEKLLCHEDRDKIIAAIDDGITVKDSREKGNAFEEEAEELARIRGIFVERPPRQERAVDLYINGWRVQTKHIDQLKKNGKVAINNMRRVKENDNKRGYTKDELDFVVLKHMGSVYVIDTERLEREDGMLFSEIDPQLFANCIDNWDAIVLKEQGPYGPGQQQLF